MITFEEKLDKLLAKKNQTDKGKTPAPDKTPRYKKQPDPVPTADYTFYLLYL